MKKLFFCLALAISVLSHSVLSADIVITEVMSSSSHPGGTSNGDWFEVTNNGASAVNITGWSWDDDSATAGIANFGAITSIGAGESIIVTSETLAAEAAWRTDWNVAGSVQVVNLGNTVPGLSSAGDAISIFDNANVLVTSVSFSTATLGSSFEWDQFGNNLALSINGENGAYVASFNGVGAAGTDIGSPGFAAVPEPGSALLMLGLSIVGCMVRRRNV